LWGATALTRYLDPSELPDDNNCVDNQIRPIAIERTDWLFAEACERASGSPRAAPASALAALVGAEGERRKSLRSESNAAGHMLLSSWFSCR
jgi:hypothetical protein